MRQGHTLFDVSHQVFVRTVLPRERKAINCSSFHLRVFLGLSNSQGQRQTSILSLPRHNYGERKAKFNLEMSRTTQMQLYKWIHVP
jgi:hypothetical protein